MRNLKRERLKKYDFITVCNIMLPFLIYNEAVTFEVTASLYIKIRCLKYFTDVPRATNHLQS